jgi:GNAT superfamily N-acetyltransferase
MALRIVALEARHLEDAADLVGARYRVLQAQVPALPDRYADRQAFLPLLRDLAGRSPGVAALQRGRLVGFLLGAKVADLWGRRAAFSPEWANASAPAPGRRVYEELYAALAPRWTANGCFVHAVGLFADDGPARDAWHWLGFGLAAVDAVRALSPVVGPAPADLAIRRAGPADLERAVALSDALRRHLAAAPTFLARVERRDRAAHERWLADRANALWLADAGDEAVAGLEIGPASDNACTIIRDAGTASITGAFTRADARGRGVATALLERALAWAREHGYARCAVDFEPMNVLAARFWLRHFRPVCYSVARHVDERVAWADARRSEADTW